MDITLIPTTLVFLAKMDAVSAHQLPTVPHVLLCPLLTQMDLAHAPTKLISLSQLKESDIVLLADLTVLPALILIPAQNAKILTQEQQITNVFVLPNTTSMSHQTPVTLAWLDVKNVKEVPATVKAASLHFFSKEILVKLHVIMDLQLLEVSAKDVLQDV